MTRGTAYNTREVVGGQVFIAVQGEIWGGWPSPSPKTRPWEFPKFNLGCPVLFALFAKGRAIAFVTPLMPRKSYPASYIG